VRLCFNAIALVLAMQACSESSNPAPAPGAASSGSASDGTSGTTSDAGGGERDSGTGGSAPGNGGAENDAGRGAGGSAIGGSAVGGGAAELGGAAGSAGDPSPCPPAGPFGTSAGSVAPNVELLDCDGNLASLHDLCEAPAAVVYTFAAWCSVCKAHMMQGLPNQLLAAHEAKGFQEWVVVTQNASGDAPSAELCAITRDTYALTPRVLYDPNGALSPTLSLQVNSAGLVLSRGGVIELNSGYNNFDAVEAKVEELLDTP
jgi:peroxiredoxin